MNKDNKEILIRAGKRFLRNALWTLVSLVIPALADTLLELQLDDATKGLLTVVLIPTLTGIEKALRDKGLI